MQRLAVLARERPALHLVALCVEPICPMLRHIDDVFFNIPHRPFAARDPAVPSQQSIDADLDGYTERFTAELCGYVLNGMIVVIFLRRLKLQLRSEKPVGVLHGAASEHNVAKLTFLQRRRAWAIVQRGYRH